MEPPSGKAAGGEVGAGADGDDGGFSSQRRTRRGEVQTSVVESAAADEAQDGGVRGDDGTVWSCRCGWRPTGGEKESKNSGKRLANGEGGSRSQS